MNLEVANYKLYKVNIKIILKIYKAEEKFLGGYSRLKRTDFVVDLDDNRIIRSANF